MTAELVRSLGTGNSNGLPTSLGAICHHHRSIVEQEIAAALEHRQNLYQSRSPSRGSLLNEVAMVWQAAETGLERGRWCCSPRRGCPLGVNGTSLPLLPVLSFNEISPEIEIQSVGMVNISNAD